MLVFHDLKAVIITPPKCGSRTLMEAFGGRRRTNVVLGRYPGSGCVDPCSVDVAPDWLDYRVALVVRNPYKRAVSLWRHMVHWEMTHGRGCCGFQQFVDQARDPDVPWHYMYKRTLDDYRVALCDHYREHGYEHRVKEMHVIYIEELKKTLTDFLGPVAVNQSQIMTCFVGDNLESTDRQRMYRMCYHDDEVVNAVREWMGKDFYTFGYDLDVLP